MSQTMVKSKLETEIGERRSISRFAQRLLDAMLVFIWFCTLYLGYLAVI